MNGLGTRSFTRVVHIRVVTSVFSAEPKADETAQNMNPNVQEPADQPSEDANIPQQSLQQPAYTPMQRCPPKKSQFKKQQPALPKFKNGGQVGKNGKGKTPGKYKLANNNIIPL